LIVKSNASLNIAAGVCDGRRNPDSPSYLGGRAVFTPTLRNDGHVTIATGGLLRDSTASIVNTGTFTLDDDTVDSLGSSNVTGGCLHNSGADYFCLGFEFDNSGVINRAAGPNPSTLEQAHLVNTGTVHAAGSLAVINPSWTGQLTGTWTVDAGATLTF